MRIHDHIIRVFAFGGGIAFGGGDLRATTVGIFGSIQERSQLFVRAAASPDVSNWRLDDPRDDRTKERRLRKLIVSAWFERSGDVVDTIEPADLDLLVARHMDLSLVHEGSPSGIPLNYDLRSPLTAMSWRDASPEHAAVDSTETVIIPKGAGWQIVAVMPPELLRHLNGAVQVDGAWVNADPKMIRVLRISAEFDVAGSR